MMSEIETTEVERVFEELKFLREHLESSTAGLSVLNTLSSVDAKVMLLCSASYFERKVCDGILEVFAQTSPSITMNNFLAKKALSRNYHTLFSWKENNANSFFGLFGNEFKTHMKSLLDDDDLKQCMKDFMELGRIRNELVHQNYATFNLGDTAQEIYEKFKRANRFVGVVMLELSSFSPTDDSKAA